jgi:nucleoside-diphosphate-sugar epimerase
MRVFVTGATGFIGTAIVRELQSAGHQVLGLARSGAAVQTLTRLGVQAHPGTLEDLQSLTAGARAADGVIHTAFIHDFDAYAQAAEVDRRAIAALAGALEGTHKPLVAPSGTLLLPSGRIATESDEPPRDRIIAARVASEQALLAAAQHGVRTCLIRLAPSVHGVGDRAFIPTLIEIARRSGISAYVGDGSNRWPAVHRLDAARLFRLALEKAPPATILHGVAEEGVPLRSIAETIAQALHVPVRAIPLEEAHGHFGWMSLFITHDNPTSSDQTRALLDWHPNGPDLISDMRQSYFA